MSRGLPKYWQDGCSDVRTRTARLLHSGHLSDCELAVGAAREIVPAHRLLLAAASPVLEARLYGACAEPGPVDLSDVQLDIVEVALEYIYTDKLNLSSWDEACTVCRFANQFMMRSLKALCVAYLTENVDAEDACSSYELAQLVEERELAEHCLKIMRDKTTAILEANTLVEARPETLAVLFSLQPLHIESELQLLAAAERYARAQTPAASAVEEASVSGVSDAPSTSSKQPESGAGACAADSAVRAALRHVRFLTLRPEQFAECPSLSFLLSEQEILAIIMNITSNKATIPMPRGFSTSRIPRNQSSQPAPIAAVATGSKETTFRFSIPNVNSYRREQPYRSEIFFLQNLPWRVVAFHDMMTQAIKLLYFELECNWEEEGEWQCDVEVETRVLSCSGGTIHAINMSRRFKRGRSQQYISDLTWDELKGLTRNDFFITMEIHMIAKPPVLETAAYHT